LRMALSGMLMTLPNIDSGASAMPMWLPVLFDMRNTPSVPTRIGNVRIVWGLRSNDSISLRPASRLKSCSVPPI